MRPRYAVAGEERRIRQKRITAAGTELVIGDRPCLASLVWLDEHRVELTIDGARYRMYAAQDEDRLFLHFGGRTVEVNRLSDFSGAGSAAGEDGMITAPMPGAVLSVKVSTGQRVENGQLLMVIESMKMQLEIKSTIHGDVAAIHHGTGDTFDRGATLIEIKAAGSCAE